MEIVRRPTRLSELPVHPQLVRYLAQAGEFFAVVAEGTEYERDLIPRFPGRGLSADYKAVTLHQLELCTRCLTSGRLQPAKLVLDTAASGETRVSVLLQGVESLQRLFPEVVQEDITSHGTWRIIPVTKWLITMVSKSPKWGCSPYKWPKLLINGGY